MADWTDIQNDTIEPDAPLLSATMFALRDNPKAIAEGAAGAPRVVNAAIAADSLDAGKTLAVEAGDVVRFVGNSDTNYGGISFKTVADARILNPGAIRVTLEHRRLNAGNSVVEVLVNGSVAVTWSTSSESYISRSIDVSINRNARVRVRHRTDSGATGATSNIMNIRFRTSGGSLWPGAAGFVY